jgi:glycosyltransferase involved in cell wall biosynthesis
VVKEDDTNLKLLPIAIMAHNEEKVIRFSIESALRQETPPGYTTKVVVVANGCCDETEKVVASLQSEYPEQVILLSMKEKGKTIALNRSISYLAGLCEAGEQIPYVVHFDADCEFHGTGSLVSFVQRFAENPLLCAVGATCLPDVFFNSRDDIVADIYRSTYSLGKTLKINSLSGMCYCIKMEVLQQINFPEFPIAEDMFLSARLDGWFMRDNAIEVIFKTPRDLSSEIKRRERQEISTLRYHRYYSHLKRNGVCVSLFGKILSDEYRWQRSKGNKVVREWLKLEGIKSRIFFVGYLMIRQWSKFKAQYEIRKMKRSGSSDYWKVIR